MKVREELGGPVAPPVVVAPPLPKPPLKGAKRARAPDLCDEVKEA